jgi:alkylation response protein AidB-like acyl-CoA dehydrogenase
VLSMFAWALLGFGNIYYGLAQRVLDMTVEQVQKKRSIGLSRSLMRHHPAIQNDIAEMVLELEGIGPHLDRVAEEWSDGVNHGAAWGLKIVAAKAHAVEAAWRVVDRALDVVGGFGLFPASGLERLLRDARLGRIHPANSHFAREVIAKTTLAIHPDEQPRWG